MTKRTAHRMRRMAALALLVLAGSAGATEGGGSSYPLGVETQFSGLMFPEGTYHLMYLNHYEARRTTDNDGNPNPRVARFRADANAVSYRFQHIWKDVRWLGAKVESRFALAMPSVDLDFAIARPAPLAPLDRSGKHTGLADPLLVPLALGWHGQRFHQIASVELVAPWGDYDAARPVNTGRNYWQVAPTYSYTWFPNANWEHSAKFRWGFNTRNKATGYESGDELSAEWSAGYRPRQGLSFGLQGFSYVQTSDDVQNGLPVNGHGNRARAHSIGPYVFYQVTPKFAVTLKTQTEFHTRNRAEGTRLWLQMRLPL